MNDDVKKILEKLNLTFSDEEAKALLEEDVCLNERPVIDYIILRNVVDAVNNPEQAETLLTRNLNRKNSENLVKIFTSL